MDDPERLKIILYQYLFYTDVRLSEDVRALRHTCLLVRRTSEDLLRLYDAERRYQYFKVFMDDVFSLLK